MKRSVAIILLAAVLAAVSCSKETDPYTTQDEAIQAFVEALLETDAGYTVTTNEGVVRVTLSQGSGDALGRSGKATVYYAAYNLTKGISESGLVATNVAQLAEEAGLNISAIGTDPVTVSLSDTRLLDGLRKGLAGAKAGEECLVLFNAKEGRGASPYGTIPAASPLAFRIWILSLNNE